MHVHARKQSKTQALTDRILAVADQRLPGHLVKSRLRWIWITGFLAAWLARIAAKDITVRQELEALERKDPK